jgi:Tfp pilus assembly protein PilE
MLAAVPKGMHHAGMPHPASHKESARQGQRGCRPRGAAGFTTLELLVAAIVIVVLAGLVVSLAQLHIIRHQVSASMAAAEPLQARMADFYRQLGEWPAGRQDLGLPADPAASRSSYVQGTEIEHDRLTLRFGRRAHASIAGTQLMLRAVATEHDQLAWRCYPEFPGNGIPPPGPPQSPGSDLPARYWPAECR